MRILFNRRICSGHARCNEKGPDVYGLDEMGYCLPRSPIVPPELEEQARDGARNCPEGALTIVED
ncbi:MAG: ferredoxin [Caulobacter sp.]|nr:ferredoxin [Caulobacter sp.]